MDKDRILTTTKCVINGCGGAMTISNTKPSKARGIVKLYAICTKCGNHPMSGAEGQKILREILESEKGKIPKKSLENEQYFEEIPKIDEKDESPIVEGEILEISETENPKKSIKSLKIGLILSGISMGLAIALHVGNRERKKHIQEQGGMQWQTR